MRERAELRDLPVIAMTANAMVGDREAVLAAGMNDHIAKPIVVAEMFATLAKWVKPTRSGAAGIDTRRGLDNVGGDDALYRRMLGLFRDSETLLGAAEQLNAAYERQLEGRRLNAVILAAVSLLALACLLLIGKVYLDDSRRRWTCAPAWPR